MVNYNRLLSETMDAYRLYDRYEWVAQLRDLMNLEPISNDQARAYLYAMQPLIQEVKRNRNTLRAAPSWEEIYPEKPPDLIVGTLAEREEEEIPVGLFLQDNMSLILAGNAGSGKSTAIYNLVLAIDRYNQSHPDDFISIILWESKDGQLSHETPGFTQSQCCCRNTISLAGYTGVAQLPRTCRLIRRNRLV